MIYNARRKVFCVGQSVRMFDRLGQHLGSQKLKRWLNGKTLGHGYKSRCLEVL